MGLHWNSSWVVLSHFPRVAVENRRDSIRFSESIDEAVCSTSALTAEPEAEPPTPSNLTASKTVRAVTEFREHCVRTLELPDLRNPQKYIEA